VDTYADSPYRDQLFVMLGNRNSVRISRIEKDGVPSDYIIVLRRNGIENYYPKELIGAVFRSTTEEVKKWKFENDPLEFNRIRRTKKELAQRVADVLTRAHKLHSEIEGLIDGIRTAYK
jgi:hypothetical protein